MRAAILVSSLPVKIRKLCNVLYTSATRVHDVKDFVNMAARMVAFLCDRLPSIFALI